MRKWLVMATALLASVALVACGGIDTDKLEDEVSADAQEQVDSANLDATVESVTCPDDIESETGATFECQIALSNNIDLTADGEVTDGENGDVEYRIAPAGGK